MPYTSFGDDWHLLCPTLMTRTWVTWTGSDLAHEELSTGLVGVVSPQSLLQQLLPAQRWCLSQH